MEIHALGVWAHSGVGPTTSFYVILDDVGILLDTGVDPIGRFRGSGLDPTGCDYVYISHMHSDHTSGFSNFVFTRELLGRTAKEKMPSLTVLAAPVIIQSCQLMLKTQYPERVFPINWVILDPDSNYALTPALSISIIRTNHPVPCFAARIDSQLSLGFTSDSAPAPEFDQFFAGCHILIGESFGLARDVGIRVNERGHSVAEDLNKLVVSTGIGEVVPFHFTEIYANAESRVELLNVVRGDTNATVHDPLLTPKITVTAAPLERTNYDS